MCGAKSQWQILMQKERHCLIWQEVKNLRLWGAPAVVNSPQFAFMSKTIQEGKLGRIASAHGQYGHTGPTWSAFFYEKGGGSMPDLGVYNMATLTGFLALQKV